MMTKIDWEKMGGLIPAVVQDASSAQVLMLGYMTAEAVTQTHETGRVTFFSRSKNRLWVKGETSGNYLNLVSMHLDCDGDALLVKATPNGPTCHTGATSCFHDNDANPVMFLSALQKLVQERHRQRPAGSYTTSLFDAGKARIAQKVGEEGVELALARMKDDKNEMLNECADLLFHAMVLLTDAELEIADVCSVLKGRHNA